MEPATPARSSAGSTPASASRSRFAHTVAPACATCKRRKVRCDKKQPCGNCARAQTECLYFSAEHRKRKPRAGRYKDVVDRLKKLEGVIDSLGISAEDLDPSLATRRAVDPDEHANVLESVDAADAITQVSESFGRLELRQGKSRYFTNGVFARFHPEAEDLRTVLTDDNDLDDTASPPTTPSLMESLWGPGAHAAEMILYLPPADQVPWYLEKFAQRVDPYAKILHLPTISPQFLEYASAAGRANKRIPPIIFAICYGVVASLTVEECETELKEDRQMLLFKYRIATQRALASFQLLKTKDISVLQAFVLFISCIPGNESEELWPLSGLALRKAQQMGLHRDGSHFGLRPIDIELRRRLWWQICFFDVMTSELCSLDSITLDHHFDTQMPLNINDGDIGTQHEHLPQPRTGFTDMSCCLIRYEAVDFLRSVDRSRADFTADLTQKEQRISEFHARVEGTYLQDGQELHSLFHVGRSIYSFIKSRFWMVLYRPFRRLRNGLEFPEAMKDTLFLSCLESLEDWLFITTDPVASKRGNLFRNLCQWPGVAFLLLQLCNERNDELAEMAWRAVNEVQLPSSKGDSDPRTSLMMRPLHNLMARARKVRDGKPNIAATYVQRSQMLQGAQHNVSETGHISSNVQSYLIPGQEDSWHRVEQGYTNDDPSLHISTISETPDAMIVSDPTGWTGWKEALDQFDMSAGQFNLESFDA